MVELQLSSAFYIMTSKFLETFALDIAAGDGSGLIGCWRFQRVNALPVSVVMRSSVREAADGQVTGRAVDYAPSRIGGWPVGRRSEPVGEGGGCTRRARRHLRAAPNAADDTRRGEAEASGTIGCSAATLLLIY